MLVYFKKMGVCTKVPKEEATGRKGLTTGWIDTNKGDSTRRDYRSRLVGREVKQDDRLELYSATPL